MNPSTLPSFLNPRGGTPHCSRWLAGLAACAALLAPPSALAWATHPYQIIALSDDPQAFGVDLNAGGQVAFTELFDTPAPGVQRGRFYTAGTVFTLGTFGGNNSRTAALNNGGQVTGHADRAPGADPFNQFHALRWTQGGGLVDLSSSPLRSSFGAAINGRGEITGAAVFDPAVDLFHAARWSPGNRPLDLGTLGGGQSAATAINENGLVVGWSQAPAAPALRLPFRWSPETGMRPLGTFASTEAAARDINGAGQIAGVAPLRQGGPDRAFLWSAGGGLVDLTAGTVQPSGATRINDKGMLIGYISNPPGFGIGFVWTRNSGAMHIGRLGVNRSSADDINCHGHVVGGLDGRAYLWTAGTGIVDLNTRVRNAPPGLVLRRAYAINSDGAIVAASNTGLVLLSRQTVAAQRPVVGPIALSGTPRAGALLSFSASFTDIDAAETHRAFWNWDDGNSERATVTESAGRGSVSGQHRFSAGGEYTIALTVVDSSGRRTTVRYALAVPDA